MYFASWIILYLRRFFRPSFAHHPRKPIEKRVTTNFEKEIPISTEQIFPPNLTLFHLCIVRILQRRLRQCVATMKSLEEPTKRRGNFAVSVPILTFTSKVFSLSKNMSFLG